jgi:hypothetical protein
MMHSQLYVHTHACTYEHINFTHDPIYPSYFVVAAAVNDLAPKFKQRSESISEKKK